MNVGMVADLHLISIRCRAYFRPVRISSNAVAYVMLLL